MERRSGRKYSAGIAVNLYEALGVPRNATESEIRHAYLAKAARLLPERCEGAPDDVVLAVRRASEVVERAWHVLGNAALRQQYDEALVFVEGPVPARTLPPDDVPDREDRAEHIWAMEHDLGWTPSPAFGVDPPADPHRLRGALHALRQRHPRRRGLTDGNGLEPTAASGLFDPLGGFEAIADWLAPHPKIARNVTVPDVCGLAASDAFYAVAQADLHINFVRLNEARFGGDGVVTDQSPNEGAVVRRHSTLTVYVVYDDGTTPTAP